jgi:hypothetical protein
VPTKRPYQFELYRLHTLDKTNLFNVNDPQITTDGDYVRVFQHSTSNEFDRQTETERATFRWSVRDFIDFRDLAPEARPTVGFVLARSTVSQIGSAVTDEGIRNETLSESSPPLATTVGILVDLKRHLAAVEYASALMTTSVWRSILHEIFDLASGAANYRSSIRLEPVPETEEVLSAFASFSRLTRLRVVLTLPNPELTRFTAKLKAEMEHGGIKEYKQDMRNPAGLSQAQDGLPFASAAMAQDGYKIGEVLLEGVRDGRKKIVKTGRRAARATIERIRDVVREAFSGDRLRAQPAVLSILAEVDRISVPPAQRDGSEPERTDGPAEPRVNRDGD